MTLVSHAQNFEDVMLARALRSVECGFYIDVGAQDPEQFSVTKAFYDKGWKGINIEPARYWFDKLAAQRVHDINLAIALASQPGQLTFYNIQDTGLSTTNAEYAARHAEAGFIVQEEEVPCATLDQVCKDHNVGTVHFLKIDCEGAEKSVLQGFSLDTVRPWVILVEATEPLSDKPTYSLWESLLLERGYHFAYDDGLNRFYVADECSQLDASFSNPPNIFDDFVRAAEWLAQQRLREARAELDAAHDIESLSNLRSDLELAKVRVSFLDQENERREAALVEHRRLLQEAAEREAQLLGNATADAASWQAHLAYLHAENERREAALAEHRRLLEETGAIEPRQLAAIREEAEQWVRQAEYLQAENERREAALVEHRRLLDEAAAREAGQVAAFREEGEQWRRQAEYLHAENERREAALVEHRRLLDEAAAREAEQVAAVREEAEQWRQQAEYLHAENERREAALVEYRSLLDEAGTLEAERIASVRGETEQWRQQAQYLLAENERREAALVDLRDAHESMVTQIQDLQLTLARTQAELQALDHENTQGKQLLSERQRELDDTREELEARKMLLEKSALEVETLVAELDRRDRELRERSGHLEALQAEVGRLHHEVVLRDRELARCSGTISAIQKSTSWRITSPLRAARRLLATIARWAAIMAYHLLRWPARLLRPLLRGLAGWPWLSRLATRLAGENSSITRHTRLFLYGGAKTPDMDQGESSSERSNELGWHAARIYGQLRAEQRQIMEGGKRPHH